MSKTAKELKDVLEYLKDQRKPADSLAIAEAEKQAIVNFKNELKQIVGEQCDCFPCHRFRNLIQEIENVENKSSQR